jgi:hypothetical protein
MKIPIIKAGSEIPTEGPAYIIGRDGFYLKKSSKLFDATVKVDSIPEYEPVMESLQWNAPKLPYSIIQESLAFFRSVYKMYKSEAVLMLALKDAKWEIAPPEQTVSGASLEYVLEKGITPFGTIHSHCEMGAFFSNTDHDDVAGFDGLHIVIGRITQAEPEIKIGVYANGRLFEFEPEMILENMPVKAGEDEVHPWLSKVETQRKPSRFFPGFSNFFDEDYEDEIEEGLLWNAS